MKDGAYWLEVLAAARLLTVEAGRVRWGPGWLGAYLSGQVEPAPDQPPVKGYWGQKVVLGLTGNIATGKSTVLAMLESLGAAVIDADGLVHQLREPGEPGYAPLVEVLGQDILRPDGHVDASRLAAMAFNDRAVLARLEQIFRPLVVAEVERLGRASDRRVVVVEAIKLLEGDLRDQVDDIWVVDAPRQQQVERLIRFRGLSREQAIARIEAQNPQEDKLAQADVVIRNAGDVSAIWGQVLEAWSDVLVRLLSAGWLTDELVIAFVRASLARVPAAISAEKIMTGLRTLAEAMIPHHDMPLILATQALNGGGGPAR